MKILLDIDGVCSRLIMHAMKHVGCSVDIFNDDHWPVKGDYSVVNAARALGVELTPQKFWRSITRDVWASSPPYDTFESLLGRCEQIAGRDGVCFLSSPTIDPDCLAGKLEWIQRYAPRWMHRQFLIGPRKEFCAHPNALLIDDSDDNCGKFVANGGHVIHVPRPWNSRHAESPQVVFTELETFAESFTC
jgi:hypothetical protein